MLFCHRVFLGGFLSVWTVHKHAVILCVLLNFLAYLWVRVTVEVVAMVWSLCVVSKLGFKRVTFGV